MPAPFKENRFLRSIYRGSAFVILLAAYRPDAMFDWALESMLLFGFIALVLVTYRKFPFSDASYLCMFVFLCLHEWGAHYKYSDVPLGEWIKPLLHTTRNDYDRIAHFSFGLLCAYPMQEIAIRVLQIRGPWRYYLPVECTLALSAIYEMMEAGMAGILSPERGEEFVGMQGDMWDSQKDMLVAALGSVVAVIIIQVLRNRRAAAAVRRELEYAARPD